MITEIYYDNWKWSLYCMLLLGQYTAITEIWTVFKGWCYLTEVTSDPKSKVKTACNYPGDLLEYNQLLCKIQDNINVRSCPRVFVLQSGSSLFQHDSQTTLSCGLNQIEKYYGQGATVSSRMMTGNKLCTSDVVICCCWSFIV